MIFRTELNIPPSKFKIDHNDAILLIGSCFSHNIGERLQKYKFNCISNPFGTIFNPVSIAKVIQYSCNNQQISTADLISSQGMFVHPDFYSSLSDADAIITSQNINNKIAETGDFIRECKYIFITLGTSTAYRYHASESIVANCHKIASTEFTKVNISIEDGVRSLSDIISQIKKKNPSARIIFTISPVRHTKDGIIQNARSKARLLQMVEELENKYNEIEYLPAFEWMMDDLRDYRFYKADLIHPNDQALEYIWEKFCSHYFEEATIEINNKIEGILMAAGHKPFSKDITQHQAFCKKNLLEIDRLVLLNPNLNFEEEKKVFTQYAR